MENEGERCFPSFISDQCYLHAWHTHRFKIVKSKKKLKVKSVRLPKYGNRQNFTKFAMVEQEEFVNLQPVPNSRTWREILWADFQLHMQEGKFKPRSENSLLFGFLRHFKFLYVQCYFENGFNLDTNTSPDISSFLLLCFIGYNGEINREC